MAVYKEMIWANTSLTCHRTDEVTDQGLRLEPELELDRGIDWPDMVPPPTTPPIRAGSPTGLKFPNNSLFGTKTCPAPPVRGRPVEEVNLGILATPPSTIVVAGPVYTIFVT